MRQIINPILALPRRLKQGMAVCLDASSGILAVWVAYYLRLGEWVPLNEQPIVQTALAVVLALFVFTAFGFYHVVIRHIGRDAVASSVVACAVYGVAYAAIITAYGFDGVPRTVGLIQPVLLFILVSGWRVAASYILSHGYLRLVNPQPGKRILIYGAGTAGQELARSMSVSSREMQVAGFIDDDRSLKNTKIQGLPVFEGKSLEVVVDRLQIDEVLLAMPSISRSRRSVIIDELAAYDVNVRTLPGLIELAHGTVQASDLREVTIEDLLKRDVVPHDPNALREHISGKIVLVSGAGGSIGSELCRQILTLGPAKLLLVDNAEYALYSIHHELEPHSGGCIIPLLASVADRGRIGSILATWRPHAIFHAAAYKHVPLVEHNPLEGMRNNVIGTRVMAELAAAYGVDNFVLVSTDKAVRPTNIMGATKRLAELVLQGLDGTAAARKSRFSMVRFGNVLGSSGSVVPLFRRQIEAGGPITITHPDITRYFMTIPEAVHLVLQASAMAEGGEVFVLDMGNPVKIRDLAINIIRLSGLTVRDHDHPEGDIAIEVVGLRPGEKLYEELLIGNNPEATTHPRIMKAQEHSIAWTDLHPRLDVLEDHIDAGEIVAARDTLTNLVREFTAAETIVDWVYLASETKRQLHDARM